MASPVPWPTGALEHGFFHMSYGQYSWLITIKNGASHPMVPLGIYNNHYKDPYYGWDDHQPYSEY